MGAAAGEGAPPLPAATGLPAPPGATAGEISFLPKLIRLFETLFIFRGAPLALVLLKNLQENYIGGNSGIKFHKLLL